MELGDGFHSLKPWAVPPEWSAYSIMQSPGNMAENRVRDEITEGTQRCFNNHHCQAESWVRKSGCLPWPVQTMRWYTLPELAAGPRTISGCWGSSRTSGAFQRLKSLSPFTLSMRMETWDRGVLATEETHTSLWNKGHFKKNANQIAKRPEKCRWLGQHLLKNKDLSAKERWSKW